MGQGLADSNILTTLRTKDTRRGGRIEMTNNKHEKVEPDYYIVGFKGKRIDFFIERNHLKLKPDELIIVQAEKGKDLGRIILNISKETFEKRSGHRYPLEILRRATQEETEKLHRLRKQEDEIMETCQEYIDFRGLNMKLVLAEYQFDKNKLTIFFTADERIDFRELVKDLAATYRTRIELRQIGVRDEAKRLSGIGPCGRPLCCASFLNKFEPISTQMARTQNLAVNPSKISGLCERLMCCLAYEMNFYEDVEKKYPKPGDTVLFENGKKLKIDSVNYFSNKIILLDIEENEKITLPFVEYRKKLADRKQFLEKWISKKNSKQNSNEKKNENR